MNSGFNDFQDLINTTTTSEDIQSLQDEVKSLEEEVADNETNIADNETNIADNETNIATNSGLISTNVSAIANNGVLINNNTTAIATNTSNISTNTTSIATLNQEVLKKDGSVPLDFGYTPSTTYDIATKTYVDSHSTSTAYLRVDGTNSMNAPLDLAANSIYLDTSANYIRSVNNEIYLVSPQNVVFEVGNSVSLNCGVLKNVMFKNLDMVNNDLINVSSINNTNFNVLSADVSLNTGNIALNTGNITLNTTNISTNTSNIAGNTGDIQNNIADILTKLTKSGDTMTGALYFGNTSNYILRTPSALRLESSDYFWFNIGNTLYAQIGNNSFTVYEPLEFTYTLNGITVAEFANLSGITGSIQSQLDDRIKKDGSVSMTGDLNLANNNIINIGSLNGISPSQIITNQTNIQNNTTNINNLDNDKLDKAGGTMTGDLNMGSNKITSLATGTVSTDAVNKGQVDSGLNLKVNKSGDTMTGDLNMGNNKITSLATGTTSTDAVNKGQVDTSLNLKVNKSGDTMTGTLFFNYPGIYAEFGANDVNHTSSTGAINYNVVSSTKHELVLIGAQSDLDTNNLRNVRVDGSLQVDDSFTVLDGGTVVNGQEGISTGSWMYRQLYIRHPLCPSNKEYGWRMGCQYPINTSSTDMDMYFEVMRGTSSRIAAGLWDQNGSSSAINFTGQHRCVPEFEYTQDKVGLIVEATGRYMNFIEEGAECSQISCITINDSLPVVALCNEVRSKKVFGIISNEEEKKRQYTTGAFVSFYDKVDGDERLYINSVGEGAMWVSNKNGNLENGDWVCSSGENGYGMKQDEPYLANFTVAKITMSCDFNPQMEEVKIWENGGWRMTGEFRPAYECITLDVGIKVAFVGVTYHCG